MPSEIVHCVLCDRRNRAARSKFAKLATSERQEKIRDGYKKRNSYSLNHSLMNICIHAQDEKKCEREEKNKKNI